MTVLDYVGLYGLVALGIVLLTGVAGVTSFGQAAFAGVGAYATAVVTLQFGLSPWIGLVAAMDWPSQPRWSWAWRRCASQATTFHSAPSRGGSALTFCSASSKALADTPA